MNFTLMREERSRPGFDACVRRLPVEDPGDTAVMVIDFTHGIDRFLEDWRRTFDDPPGALSLITTGEMTRSGESGTQPTNGPPSSTVEIIPTPGNLTQLGVAITDGMRSWEWEGDRRLVYLHSLSTLLNYVDTKQVFQFLTILKGHLTDENVDGYFHINASMHDEKTVQTLTFPFDAIVECDLEM